MKNIINFTAITSLTAIVGVAAVESAGLSAIAYAAPFATFITGLALVSLRHDYTARHSGYEPRLAKPLLLPADEAFAPVIEKAEVSSERRVNWTARHRRIRRELNRR